jgi:hypothetical protein
VRIYLPATLARLERWLAAGEATLDPDGPGALAYTVTPTLREWYYEADLDELEHAAQRAAAAGSLPLLAADPTASRRRVVVAADIDEAAVVAESAAGRAAATIRVPIPVNAWASALVDDPDVGPVVELAVTSLPAAAGGDPDAQFALDDAEATELGWYGIQELRRWFE